LRAFSDFSKRWEPRLFKPRSRLNWLPEGYRVAEGRTVRNGNFRLLLCEITLQLLYHLLPNNADGRQSPRVLRFVYYLPQCRMLRMSRAVRMQQAEQLIAATNARSGRSAITAHV
jgi:hypothetical protein